MTLHVPDPLSILVGEVSQWLCNIGQTRQKLTKVLRQTKDLHFPAGASRELPELEMDPYEDLHQ